jgi:hypothetical protein
VPSHNLIAFVYDKPPKSPDFISIDFLQAPINWMIFAGAL